MIEAGTGGVQPDQRCICGPSMGLHLPGVLLPVRLEHDWTGMSWSILYMTCVLSFLFKQY